MDQREASKKDYGLFSSERGPGLDQINSGCLQRIADALEKMAEPHRNLLNEVEMLRHNNETLEGAIKYLERKVSAYKGIIKKMKGAR